VSRLEGLSEVTGRRRTVNIGKGECYRLQLDGYQAGQAVIPEDQIGSHAVIFLHGRSNQHQERQEE